MDTSDIYENNSMEEEEMEAFGEVSTSYKTTDNIKKIA